MTLIKKLCERIEDEIQDSEMYAKWALEVKDEHRGMADVLYGLSLDEMQHADALHGEVVELISDYRRENGEPPEAMMAVYEYLHKKQIEEAKEAKAYQNMYRER